MITLEFIGLFVLIAGFVVGLGAVTVIDIHGFLARKSPYWTEATIRSHKVTKPLIWFGILLVICGGALYYAQFDFPVISKYHGLMVSVLILNGLFLSFYISPYLIEKEQQGKEKRVLPGSLQHKVIISFLISFFGWWGALALLIMFVTS